MPAKLRIPARQVIPSGGDRYLRCGNCGGQAFRAQVLPREYTARLRYLVCSRCEAVGEVDDAALIGTVKLIRPGTLRMNCEMCRGSDMKVHVRPPVDGQGAGTEARVRHLQCANMDCSNLFGVGDDATLGGTGRVTGARHAAQPLARRTS